MAEYNFPPDLIEQIKALKTRVEQLEKTNPLQNASIDLAQAIATNQFGDQIGLQVRDYDDNAVFQVGGDVSTPRPDGKPQPFVTVRRDDGSLAFCIWDSDPESVLDGYGQTVQLWSRNGNILFSEDKRTGYGIGRPFITYPMYNLKDQGFQSTSATFEGAYSGFVTLQHPLLLTSMVVLAGGGNEGQVRWVMDGSVVAGPHSFSSTTVFTDNIEVDDEVFGSTYSFELQVRRTAGTGTVACYPRYVMGGGFV